MGRFKAAWLACVLCASIAVPGTAHAASMGGVTLPDTYPVGGQTLVLNGMGIRTLTILNVRVYAAGLYVAQRSASGPAVTGAPTPKVVLLQFLHSASKSDIDKHYREGEARNCGHGECDKADEADFERLIAATPAAGVGDTLTYIVTPRGLRALFNNREIADIPNPDLGQRILAGFIGPTPPSEDLKRHLLGQN